MHAPQPERSQAITTFFSSAARFSAASRSVTPCWRDEAEDPRADFVGNGRAAGASGRSQRCGG